MAASLSVAEQYVQAFSQLAKESNTILLPTSTGDVTSMVTQVSLEPRRGVWELQAAAQAEPLGRQREGSPTEPPVQKHRARGEGGRRLAWLLEGRGLAFADCVWGGGH